MTLIMILTATPYILLGANNRAARVLFVLHPREQGEWCSQTPNVASVLAESFALLSRMLDEQHPSRPVNIPIITRHWEVRQIFTGIRTAYLSLNRRRGGHLVLGNLVSIVDPQPLFLNKCNRKDCTKWGA